MPDTPPIVDAFCRVGPWVEREVGAEQVIVGTDAALFDIAHQIGKVLFADISDAQKTLILGENARRVFRRPLRFCYAGRVRGITA